MIGLDTVIYSGKADFGNVRSGGKRALGMATAMDICVIVSRSRARLRAAEIMVLNGRSISLDKSET